MNLIDMFNEGLEDPSKINEVSTELLARYKELAGAQASELDKAAFAGAPDAKEKLAKAHKRFKGIVQATKKQFANDAKQLSIQELATISDEALDNAYGYGRSTPGNTFGWKANMMSAAYAKKMIDAGVTDIEKIADAIHKGWNVTAQKFVQDPDQFSDTEKLRQAGKLDGKLQQRAKLMSINYAQLPDDEQEKDRVVARALLHAIKGRQGVAEGYHNNIMHAWNSGMSDDELVKKFGQGAFNQLKQKYGAGTIPVSDLVGYKPKEPEDKRVRLHRGLEGPGKVLKSIIKQQGVAEGAPELLKKEMPLHRHAEKLLAQNGVSRDDPDYHHHLANTIKHLRKFGNIYQINKQGVAEDGYVDDTYEKPVLLSFELYNIKTNERVYGPFKAYDLFGAAIKADDYLEAKGINGKGLTVRRVKKQGVAEATGDPKFDKMMRTITKGSKKQATADRKAERVASAQRAKNAFGPSPADKLTIKKGVSEGVAETLPMDDAIKVLKHYGANSFIKSIDNLKFYKNDRPLSIDLIQNDDGTRSVRVSQLNSATRQLKGQGVSEESAKALVSKWMELHRRYGGYDDFDFNEMKKRVISDFDYKSKLEQEIKSAQQRNQSVAEDSGTYKVYCSQCGNEFTRNKKEGYSHCRDHNPKKTNSRKPLDKNKKNIVDDVTGITAIDNDIKSIDQGVNETSAAKPVLKGHYVYDSVTSADAQDAESIGLKFKQGSWCLPVYNTSGAKTAAKKQSADRAFGNGRWVPVGRISENKKTAVGINENRMYYRVAGTSERQLRNDFKMAKDSYGWYLKEDSSRSVKLDALRTFGQPTAVNYMVEYDLAAFSGSTQTLGSDNVVSPVGSVPKTQRKKAKQNG